MRHLDRIHDLDSKLSLWIHQAGTGRIPRVLLRLLEVSGDGVLWIVVIAVLAYAAPSSPQIRLLVPGLLLGFVLDVLLVAAIKAIVRRPRPVYNKGMFIIAAVDHWSFPSGHSSRSLFMATFFWINLRSLSQTSDTVFSWPLLGFVVTADFLVFFWAAATAISRILLGRHYVMDVLAGSMLGILEAKVVDRFARPVHELLTKKLSQVDFARKAV